MITIMTMMIRIMIVFRKFDGVPIMLYIEVLFSCFDRDPVSSHVSPYPPWSADGRDSPSASMDQPFISTLTANRTTRERSTSDLCQSCNSWTTRFCSLDMVERYLLRLSRFDETVIACALYFQFVMFALALGCQVIRLRYSRHGPRC